MSDITLTVSAPGPTVDLAVVAGTSVTLTVSEGGGVSTHAGLPDLATSGHPVSAITGALSAAAAAAAYQPLDADLTAIAALSSPATSITNAVPKTLVDAAGDLLVGSAADTVARLPLGSAGQVLRVNSGATAPEWAAAVGGVLVNPAAAGVSTSVYNLPGVMITTVATTFGPAGNRIYYAPIVVTKPITVTAMYLSVAGGSAGTNVAVGLFAATSAMQPTGDALISAAVSTASTGLKTVAVSPPVVLQPGVYLTAMNPSAGGLAFDVVQGRTPYASGGWHSATFSAPTLISASRTYDGALSAVAWDAISTGSAGLSYPVTFAWTVN